jgi:Flp pilus assembly protein TadG
VYRQEGGQSVVETALALSILVFALMGGADMARAFAVQVGVVNAARVGAEAGVTRAATTDLAIRTFALDELSRVPGVNGSLATVTVTHSTGTGGEGLLAVRVQYPFRTLVPWPLVRNDLALDRSAVFRKFP